MLLFLLRKQTYILPVIICILFMQTNGIAQNLKKRDSLENYIKKTVSDSSKASALAMLSDELIQYDIKKAKSHAIEAINIAQKIKYSKAEAEALLALGKVYRTQNNYLLSLNKTIAALRIFEKINLKSGQAKSYFELGYVYKEVNNYHKAINSFTKALYLYKEDGDESRAASSQMVMGHVNADKAWELKDTLYCQKALSLYLTSLKYYQKTNDKERISVTLLNIANIYLGFNKIYPSDKYIRKSLDYSGQSLKISQELNDKLRVSINICNIGEANYAQKKYELALDNFFKAYELLKDVGNINYTLETLRSIVAIYKELKMYNKALEFSKEHFKIAQANNYISEISNNYLLTSEIYLAQKKYKEAYENRVLYEKYLNRILNEEKAKALIKSQIEFESDNKDKEIALLNKTKELQSTKLKQEQKTRNYLIGTVFLILLLLLLIYNRFIVKTKANKIIEEKSKQLEKLSIVARETANGVFITDAKGDIEWFNEGFSKLFGWESIEEYKEKRGKNIFKVSGNNDIANLIATSINEKKSVTYENATPTKGKNQLWIQTTLTPIFNEDGDLRKMVFVETDITKLKNSEEQYLAVNKELEAFSYSVSHDLRSPLRAINGYSKIILEDYASNMDADGLKALNAILNNSKKMGELIDDLLTFSRLGRTALTTSEIDMHTLVNMAIEQEANENSEKIKFTIKTLLPSNGTESLIKQVWVNLLSNAIKFTKNKSNPLIEIGSFPSEDNYIVYYIKDNGAGFDTQYYNKLFGVFQRLHSQDEFEGTGIGLAIVDKIIHRHNGNVWADSKINEGSTFYFSLPNSNS